MKKFEKLTRHTPLTPFGWFVFFALVLVPLLLGFVGGYTTQDTLLQLQSKTNGMEHTDNWEQLHKAEVVNNDKQGY